MRTFTLTFAFLIIIQFNVFSQLKSNYARGFEIGFKEGYCYSNKNTDCFYPLTPLSPLPQINENADSYTQGYNRGFQFGLDLSRSHNALNDANSNLQNQQIRFNDYIRQNPVNAMVAVGLIKQKKYDLRKDWIQQSIYQLGDLRNTLFSSSTLPKGYDPNSTRARYWKAIVDYTNSIRGVDFSEDYQFGLIQSKFNTLEKYLYTSYNELMSLSSEKIASNTSSSISTGNISFWTNIKRSADMKVYLDGNYIGNFESYFEDETPDCEQIGTITVRRSPGTYNFYAKSSNKIWRGSVTVSAGICTLQGITKK
jgi:hypothetical protein